MVFWINLKSIWAGWWWGKLVPYGLFMWNDIRRLQSIFLVVFPSIPRIDSWLFVGNDDAMIASGLLPNGSSLRSQPPQKKKRNHMFIFIKRLHQVILPFFLSSPHFLHWIFVRAHRLRRKSEQTRYERAIAEGRKVKITKHSDSPSCAAYRTLE